ncbi:4'-phosphopantetheinyl transferase family protein [Desulfobulbus alkaliphilus]|uniref:4'-phosphopantetheinyl transferase family protein n=1 Tax=Desulfobulbus alkaliphilus TaxID=869814 RepID=UPI001963E6BC|nr:4'-phosphopantetheinyl transferase superfamily protein [Desulfobulbus alkaliphilus]MBM9538114.1 4'-phosphopantetheinyl transferase superfamily protein [Desulfobulbus alkaliphilus]
MIQYSIIPDLAEKTSSVPDDIAVACRPLWAEMDRLAVRFAPLAAHGARLTLLDLEQLRPLLDEEAHCSSLHALLAPAEARIFTRFAYPKRRLEWLGGRLVAKHCLARLGGMRQAVSWPYSAYALLPGASGQPVLTAPAELAETRISISHSRRYAAAVATAAGPCGIDIQHKTDRLHAVQERFTSAAELARLNCIPDPLVRLTLLWAAKEAVKKCWLPDAPSLFDRISLTEVRTVESHEIWTTCLQVRDHGRALVRIMGFDEYLVAVATGGEHA